MDFDGHHCRITAEHMCQVLARSRVPHGRGVPHVLSVSLNTHGMAKSDASFTPEALRILTTALSGGLEPPSQSPPLVHLDIR